MTKLRSHIGNRYSIFVLKLNYERRALDKPGDLMNRAVSCHFINCRQSGYVDAAA